jgi:hypothetical protein
MHLPAPDTNTEKERETQVLQSLTAARVVQHNTVVSTYRISYFNGGFTAFLRTSDFIYLGFPDDVIPSVAVVMVRYDTQRLTMV